MSPPALALYLVVVIGLLAHGCGRTSLDDGFGDGFGPGAGGSAGGAGGRGGSGSGGITGVGGRNGAGGSATIPCGGDNCTPGSQVCCTRLTGTQPVQACVAANDPAACPPGGQVVACFDASACAPSQLCCLSTDNLAVACRAPTQCVGGVPFVLCDNNAGCPATAPRCCMLGGPSRGVCVPRTIPCP